MDVYNDPNVGTGQKLNRPTQPGLRGIALCEESLNEPSVG
jgi:hypothetical protein